MTQYPKMMTQYPNLFRPITLAGLTLKNRMLSAPLSLADIGPEGRLTAENIDFYRLRAAGGMAVVTVGESIVDTVNGQSHPMQIALDNPDVMPSLTRCADAIHSHNAAASIELSHGGALCVPEFLKGNGQVKGPSGYVDRWGDTIVEMTHGDIQNAVEAFGRAAAMVKACGFDMVMLHAGHGWLLHQFISPMTNHRTDEFGGSFQNRMRIVLMAIDEVRKAVGRAFPIELRISGSERVEGGYGLETGIEIAKAVDAKVDLIHVSAGTQEDEYSAVLMHPGTFQKEGENAYLAAEIKKHVTTPVTTVGGFCTPEIMESFLAEGNADCISVGRAAIADPFMPEKAREGRSEDITPCLRCGECQSGMIKNHLIRCTVNPLIGRENEYFHPLPVNKKRKVLVAGGGPGGLQAAITACERGHEVILCEAGPTLGGALRFAELSDFKGTVLNYRDSQIRKVSKLPVEVRLNTRVDKALVDLLEPDVIIAAVGSVPFIPPIPGSTGPNVLTGSELNTGTPVGNRIVIIGGGTTGCELAVHYARNGHRVVILEMQKELALECGRMHRINLLRQIAEEEGIEAATGMICRSISSEGVMAEHIIPTAAVRFFECDTVILATGMIARRDEVEKLRPLCREFHVAGDAEKARNVMMAVREGYDAAVDIGL